MTETVQIQKQEKPNVGTLLTQYKSQIEMALPKHLTADRMVRIALTEVRKNPDLANCEPLSFMSAIIQCAQLGLEPGSGLGHAYLIPFYNNKKGYKEVQLIPGYRGLMDIARRSGMIQSISARCVFENDDFSYEYGFEEKLHHVPAKENPGKLVYVYACATFKDGGRQFEVMTMSEIESIRKRGRNNPVWNSDFNEMARKTAVRRLFKYLPTSIENREHMERVVTISDNAEIGVSNVELIPNIDPMPIENSADEVEKALE